MQNPIRSSRDGALPEALSSQLGIGEEPLLQVASDLAPEGAAARLLVVVTRHRVLVHHDDDRLTIVPLDDVISVRAETLVGGGRLRPFAFPAPLRCSPASRASLAESTDFVAASPFYWNRIENSDGVSGAVAFFLRKTACVRRVSTVAPSS